MSTELFWNSIRRLAALHSLPVHGDERGAAGMILACISNMIHTNMPHLNFLTEEMAQEGEDNYGCNEQRECGL
jgi:hypothetical protein